MKHDMTSCKGMPYDYSPGLDTKKIEFGAALLHLAHPKT